MNWLPFSKPFPHRCVLPRKRGNQAALLERLAELEATHLLHFSCHGTFNPINPLESGLQLADASLTLSACETGIPDFRSDSNSDEYISLTSRGSGHRTVSPRQNPIRQLRSQGAGTQCCH